MASLNATGQAASKSDMAAAINDVSDEQKKLGKFHDNVTISALLKKSKDENDLVENLLSRKSCSLIKNPLPLPPCITYPANIHGKPRAY